MIFSHETCKSSSVTKRNMLAMFTCKYNLINSQRWNKTRDYFAYIGKFEAGNTHDYILSLNNFRIDIVDYIKIHKVCVCACVCMFVLYWGLNPVLLP